MIIGNGDIASVLTDKEGITYFASGVSDSSEYRESEFKRELDLLLKQNKNQKIVYFSSLCVFYLDATYARHKRMMEEVVKSNFRKYTIMRLGNITWGKNPHTIVNFFKNKIKNKEKLKIKNTYRYLVDKEEFLHWIDMIPDWNCEMNVTGRRMKVCEIVKEIHEKSPYLCQSN